MTSAQRNIEERVRTKRRESTFIEACFTTRENEWALESPGVPQRSSRAAQLAPWLVMLTLFLFAVVR